MSRKPERELRYYVNQSTGIVEIVLLADGSPLGSIAYDQDQATRFCKGLVEAIETLNKRKIGLLVPEKVGAPFH